MFEEFEELEEFEMFEGFHPETLQTRNPKPETRNLKLETFNPIHPRLCFILYTKLVFVKFHIQNF
jgi:hypothetical protein